VPTWKKRDPQHKAFNCGFYWHYRKSGLYLAVYDLIGNVTSGGKNTFFSSIEKVAEYFNADYETVRRVFKQLVKAGWLKRAPNTRKYFWVDHDEWVKTHPNECCKRLELVWQQDTDPLVGKLYAICDGTFRLYENHVVAMRKHASDDEILHKFRVEVEAAKASRGRGSYTGTSPKSCFWRVHNHFKQRTQQAKTLSTHRVA